MNQAMDRGFFGHPLGLRTLFFTEMWERFSYYGMRAILILFMTANLAEGGLELSKADASVIYGLYTSMVYLLPLLGGWIADNLIGMRRAVFAGGVVIMIGHILLALHGVAFFYTGLSLVAIGTGLLKPNISAIVGQLYKPEDQRRDSGFSIFYMGINLGAFLAPLVCGWLAQSEGFRSILQGWGMDPKGSWHWGFGAAAVGMFFGLVQYALTQKNLGLAGLVPAGAATAETKAAAMRTFRIAAVAAGAIVLGLIGVALTWPDQVTKPNIGILHLTLLSGLILAFFFWLLTSPRWTSVERRKLGAIAVLFLGSCVFWGAFEQAGSTLTLFAEEKTDNSVFGLAFPSSFWQSANAALIVILTPLFAWLWTRLGDFDRSSMIRFSVGILFAGLGFAVLVGGANQADALGKASPLWLLTVYLLHTIGELCLSPVGLSSMTKLAPQQVQGLMLGIFFASISVGSTIGAKVSGVYEQFPLPTLFAAVAGATVAVALVMAAFIKPVTKLVDKPETAKPAP